MTTYLIVDAGVAFRLIVPSAQQQSYIDLMTNWQQAGHELCAPTLWAYEIASAFNKAVHFGQLSAETGRAGLSLAYQLGIQLFAPDEEQAQQALTWSIRLGRAAAYDSFYLALAESLDCEFWTADKRLFNAAARPWIKLAPEGA